jgi:hypothetical protein
MPTRSVSFLFFFALFSPVSQNVRAQAEASPNDSVRVSVIVNGDGSTTAYHLDTINHKAAATTTEHNGKVREKIHYVLDDAGRFASGKVYSPDGKLLFTTIYRYDSTGPLREEDRFGKDGQPMAKIVYDYDAAGRQTGYSVLDRNGQVIGRTSAPKPTPTPKGRQ